MEAFVDFQIPKELGEYPEITTEQKKKILGLNAAKMGDIPVPAELQLPSADEPAVGPRGARQDGRGRRSRGRGVRWTSLRDQAYAALTAVMDPEPGRTDHRSGFRPLTCGHAQPEHKGPSAVADIVLLAQFRLPDGIGRQRRFDQTGLDAPRCGRTR